MFNIRPEMALFVICFANVHVENGQTEFWVQCSQSGVVQCCVHLIIIIIVILFLLEINSHFT